MHIDICSHVRWFNEYAAGKMAEAGENRGPMLLKTRHSKKVLENIYKISRNRGYDSSFFRCILLSALYHDIARFTQYLRYGTFCDSPAFDHGREGVRILKKSNVLADESIGDQHLILGAIALHNVYRLPDGLPEKQKIICEHLRDADKLDILRVLSEHLQGGAPYDPTVVRGLSQDDNTGNPLVKEAILHGVSASYNDLQSVNDFRLLLGSWFFHLNSRESKKLLLKDGYARRLVEGLPQNRLYNEARSFLIMEFDRWEKENSNI